VELNLQFKPTKDGAILKLDGQARPPYGFILFLPEVLKATIKVNGDAIPAATNGEFILRLGDKASSNWFL